MRLSAEIGGSAPAAQPRAGRHAQSVGALDGSRQDTGADPAYPSKHSGGLPGAIPQTSTDRARGISRTRGYGVTPPGQRRRRGSGFRSGQNGRAAACQRPVRLAPRTGYRPVRYLPGERHPSTTGTSRVDGAVEAAGKGSLTAAARADGALAGPPCDLASQSFSDFG